MPVAGSGGSQAASAAHLRADSTAEEQAEQCMPVTASCSRSQGGWVGEQGNSHKRANGGTRQAPGSFLQPLNEGFLGRSTVQAAEAAGCCFRLPAAQMTRAIPACVPASAAFCRRGRRRYAAAAGGSPFPLTVSSVTGPPAGASAVVAAIREPRPVRGVRTRAEDTIPLGTSAASSLTASSTSVDRFLCGTASSPPVLPSARPSSPRRRCIARASAGLTPVACGQRRDAAARQLGAQAARLPVGGRWCRGARGCRGAVREARTSCPAAVCWQC